jgi:hypothetical protein
MFALRLQLLCPSQAATLLLFNEAEELSYGEVQERLNLQVRGKACFCRFMKEFV